MKKTVIILAVAALPILVFSQNLQTAGPMKKNFIWSIGVEPSLPFGHFDTYTSFGLGGSLQGEYKPGRTGITLKFGYIEYFGKTTEGVSYPDFNYWPLLAGLKYYLSDKTYLPYIHAPRPFPNRSSKRRIRLPCCAPARP